MVNIDELCERCLSRGSRFTITARAVYDFVKSPYKVWCDCNAPPEAKDLLTEYDKLLLEQGRQHEERTVAMAYPEAETLTYTTPEEGFRLALEAMRDGVEAMHNVPIFFLPEGLVGRADILERNDEHESAFGDYHYIIKELKLSLAPFSCCCPENFRGNNDNCTSCGKRWCRVNPADPHNC